jgi:hypothetical protein
MSESGADNLYTTNDGVTNDTQYAHKSRCVGEKGKESDYL